MADQSKPISRRWLYGPFVVAGMVFFAYYLLWRVGAAEMEKAAFQWIDDQRAMGMEVTHAGIKRDGFPFFLRIHVDEPMISTPGMWRWRAERLSVDALPYDLTRVIFSPTGGQEFYAAGYGAWRFTAEEFKSSIANDKNRGWVFSVTIGGANAQRVTGGADVAIDRLVFDLAPDATTPTTLVLSLAAGGLNVNDGGKLFHLTDLQTVLNLTQTDFLFGADAASHWREAGGALIVNGLLAEIEKTEFSITGEIGLDDAYYPTGSLDAEIVNPAGLAQWLGATGVLSEKEAESTGAGLTLLAIAGGGKINAPIELKNGAAQIAGMKLADLPPAQ